MLGKSPDQNQSQIFQPLLKDFIDPKHELVILSCKIDWDMIVKKFSVLYSHTGTKSKPVRLMTGLLILKQLFNLSDDEVVEQWRSNPYYQYFCGESVFQWKYPCASSDITHFRKRIGKSGCQEIFNLSVNLFSKQIKKAQHVLVDTTVQEKNITYPTDGKLYKKIIDKCNRIREKEHLSVRQSYKFKAKEYLRMTHNFNHPKRRKQAQKALRKLKTVAGRLMRDVSRGLADKGIMKYKNEIEIFRKILLQTRHSKDKIYSLHEPEVSCIAKGKSHKKYEYGSKVSMAVIPGKNIIVGVKNFKGNPHDSKTLEPTLDHVREITGKDFKKAMVDRGFRGLTKIGETEIIIPDSGKLKNVSKSYKQMKRKLCRKRAAIEPIIGHVKHKCRMSRNYLKGVTGDEMNVLLSAAAFNFRQKLRIIRAMILYVQFELRKYFNSLNDIFQNPNGICVVKG